MDVSEKDIFSRLISGNLEQIMEERTSTPMSGDAMERKIDELLQAVRNADPTELENIKSIIRKNVTSSRSFGGHTCPL